MEYRPLVPKASGSLCITGFDARVATFKADARSHWTPHTVILNGISMQLAIANLRQSVLWLRVTKRAWSKIHASPEVVPDESAVNPGCFVFM